MSLLQRLKSFLGLSPGEEHAREESVSVTVERQPDRHDHESPTAPDEEGDQATESGTETADVVTEPDPSRGSGATDSDGPTETEPEPPAGTAPGASADDASADEADVDETDATEPAFDEGAEVDIDVAGATDAEPSEEAADEAPEDPAAEAETPLEDEPVTEISGIGPAYSDRLAAADITTVAELAGADPSELASRVDISEGRLDGWIEAAGERRERE